MMLDIILLNLMNTSKDLYSSPLHKEGMNWIILFLLFELLLQGNQRQSSFTSSPMHSFIRTVWLHLLEILNFSKIMEVILRYCILKL